MFKAVKASWLINGLDNEPVADGIVLVEDGHVVEAGPSASLALGADAEVAEFPGCTILPGLIDCHVHLIMTGSPIAAEDLQGSSDDELYETAGRNARMMLDSGITTVRDCGARNELGFRLKRDVGSGVMPGPRVLTAGRPLTSTKGHFWYCGWEVDSEAEIREAIRKQWDSGADFVKVMASGGNITPGTSPRKAQFPVEKLEVMVDEAARLGMIVTAHAHGAEAIGFCSSAGVRGIEHCSFLDENGVPKANQPLIDRLIAGNMTIGLTLAADHYLSRCRAENGLDPAGAGQDYYEAKLDLAGQLRRAGVNIVAASDAMIPGSPPNALLKEMELLGQVGFTPMESIRMATTKAAEYLGISDRLGSLQHGRLADMLVVQGNPALDLTALTNRVAVWKEGVRVASDK